MASEQAAQLERVRSKIEEAVMGFCEMLRVRGGTNFIMSELTAHVMNRVPSTAPDSPSRILRLMRAEGKLSYEVVNRSQSLYRLTRTADDLFPGHNE
jgi:hypothetical protein